MRTLLAACGGFLLGVLWMDLLFDIQTLGTPSATATASIAAYYRRATIEAYPFNRLIAAVMLLTLAGAIYRLVRRRAARALTVLATLLASAAVGLALLRVVPNAMRLGAGGDDLAVQTQLARAICVDHLLCLGAMVAFVALLIAERGGATAGDVVPRATSE